MERGNTKQEILEASLNLFSVQGFEATSISQIANAVGIRKASLYNHYESKQAILDAFLNQVITEYEKHSIFVNHNWSENTDRLPLTADAAVKMIKAQLNYIIHDPHVSKGRKMLVIEQFKNDQLSALQTKQNYTDVLGFFRGMINGLIEKGVLEDEDSEIMTAQFCLPISEWIKLVDREPERENEVMELTEKHVRQFYRIYEPKG
ncbi:MAG: TetR/AcrR family transcriptional regulator [Clostridia bacterium]|nr:TetR/AcrR family transcriptional regulator [Clostridia bacterium]